jgi:HK97 gp10 family phage protein
MMVEYEHIEGLKELLAALKELPEKIARNALRVSVYAGAKVIRDEAKIKAPVTTGPVSEGHPPPGTLKRSIIMKWIPEQSGMYNQVFAVTVRHGKKYQKQGKKGDKSQDAFYWRFVEFGTSKMIAHPFMRPAFEAKKHDAVEAIKTRLAERIEEITK